MSNSNGGKKSEVLNILLIQVHTQKIKKVESISCHKIERALIS
jgi:hypothetical protein